MILVDYSEPAVVMARAILPREIREAAVPDQFLVGNGAWCSCCFPDGSPMLGEGQSLRSLARRGCNECAGEGRVAFSAERIIADTIAEAQARREETRP